MLTKNKEMDVDLDELRSGKKKSKSRHGAQPSAAPAKEEKPAPKKRGRPKKPGGALSDVERNRRYRAKKKAEKEMKE